MRYSNLLFSCLDSLEATTALMPLLKLRVSSLTTLITPAVTVFIRQCGHRGQQWILLDGLPKLGIILSATSYDYLTI